MYVFYIGLLIEGYFEFQEQKVKLGQLEYTIWLNWLWSNAYLTSWDK